MFKVFYKNMVIWYVCLLCLGIGGIGLYRVAHTAPPVPQKPLADYRQYHLHTVQAMLKSEAKDEPEKVAKLSGMIVDICYKKQLDPKLVAAIILVESGLKENAVSKSGALGLMQLHALTWAEEMNFAKRNPFDPYTNIDMGTTILASYRKSNKDLASTLRAYSGNAENYAYTDRVFRIYTLWW